MFIKGRFSPVGKGWEGGVKNRRNDLRVTIFKNGFKKFSFLKCLFLI